MYDREYQKKWREAHCEYIKEYYQKHREQILARMRKYRETHREERRLYDKKYNEEHREEARIYHREYRENNREKVFAGNAARCILLDDRCSLCATSKGLERHHPNYAEPLKIITLCKSCHKLIHSLYSHDFLVEKYSSFKGEMRCKSSRKE